MDRVQWKSAHRSARLGRRRGVEPGGMSDVVVSLPGMRHRAAWAFVGLAVVAAALTFWRVQPGEERGQALAVSVPAASSPAADAGPSTVRS